MSGTGGDGYHEIEYIADNAGRRVSQIELPYCRQSGGSTSGSIILEVRTTSSSSPNVVASSTIPASSVQSSSLCNNLPYVNATTSIFQLNNPLDYEIGTQLYFKIRRSGVSGTYLVSGIQSGSNGHLWTDGGDQGDGWSISGIGLGNAPSIYNASSTDVSCSSFDFGCYISTAFSFLFMPSTSIIQEFASTTIQNEFPFSYWYSMQNAFDSAISSSTDQFFVVDFEIMGSTSTILSYPMMQNLVGDDSLDLIRNIFEWILWLCFGFYIYVRIKTIWS